jgi:hypothetical protein
MLIQDNTGQLETFNAEVPTAFFNTLGDSPPSVFSIFDFR